MYHHLEAVLTVYNGLDSGAFLAVISLIILFVLTITSSVYLHHQIMYVKAFIHNLQWNSSSQRKLNRSQRLKELLTGYG